ncbi:MAG TPA: DUF4124 domain-containing protein [Casimicrobiaceae bacterium]|nr:DUF4124 domain-containing protein [Casimicrobiaceae bacterium]
MLRDARLKTARLTTLLAVTLLCTSWPSLGAMYKWTDSTGRIVYSDQPPTGNVKAEAVRPAPPPANPNALKELASKDAELKKRQLDRADVAQKADKARVDAQKQAALCQQARSHVAGLGRSEMVIYRMNEKGERVVMDASARKAEVQRLELMMYEKKC